MKKEEVQSVASSVKKGSEKEVQLFIPEPLPPPTSPLGSGIGFELVKNCMSCFVMLLPSFLAQEQDTSSFDHLFLENLMELWKKAPAHTEKLVQGIISQFTSSKVKYSNEVKEMIAETLMKKIKGLTFNKLLSEFYIK